jgi:acetoin utilization protein AcuB
MTGNVDTVALNTPLGLVVTRMNRNGCRQLPVLDGDKLVGIITDRDVRLAINSPALGGEQLERHQERATLLNQLTVESCMTPDPITVTPDTPAHKAADLMGLYKFGALPVLEHEALIGIITVTDFLKYMASKRIF